MEKLRTEKDLLGEKQIPANVLWGIHTARALENFSILNKAIHPELIKAYGEVKLACAQINNQLDFFTNSEKSDAIEKACSELSLGLLSQHVKVDALQGGAGTSTNMNVNEVIANRALQILELPLGSYSEISPLDDINLHQSTNDTFPTALKISAIRILRELEQNVLNLQEAFHIRKRNLPIS